jgi:GDPmannose 4,6-dehydratase
MLNTLSLGNLEARRDWGYAGDYVEAMHLMLQQKKADDYVIGTGVSHSVRDVVEATARELDVPLSWKGKGNKEIGVTTDERVIVNINKEFYRPVEVHALCADITKAKRALGWKPKVTFEQLVSMMAQADMKRLRKLL